MAMNYNNLFDVPRIMPQIEQGYLKNMLLEISLAELI